MAVRSKLFRCTSDTQTVAGSPSCMASVEDHLLKPNINKITHYMYIAISNCGLPEASTKENY